MNSDTQESIVTALQQQITALQNEIRTLKAELLVANKLIIEMKKKLGEYGTN